MKVHLRKRPLKKKKQHNLYLEIYLGTTKTPEGKTKLLREFEYLNLYTYDKPKNAAEKQHNKEAIEFAESARSKKELDLKNIDHGFKTPLKNKGNFIDYFQKQADKRFDSQGNYGNWDSSIKHLKVYAGENLTFDMITPEFCEGFKDYLIKKAKTKSKNNLSANTQNSYFNKFRACIKLAVRENFMPKNPCEGIVGPKGSESIREYLTIDELKAAANAECRYPVLKRAFLFSCLTGLRWSDINKLTWGDVQRNKDGWRIVFYQKKTKGLQYLDISDQAVEYMDEPGDKDDRVFTGLKYSDYMNVALLQWMLKAKIDKHITFHSGRHTYAVMLLTLDVDIYTVSKLLGHSEIRTTQIYAKIIDEKKKDAINKIPVINI